MDMEHQKQEQPQPWEVEEEEEVGLVGRQYKRRDNNKPIVSAPVNGSKATEEEAEHTKELNYGNDDGNGNANGLSEANGHEEEATTRSQKKKINNSVYFDSNEGSGSAEGLETNPKDDPDIQSIINHHHQKDSGDEIFPCSSPKPVKDYKCEEKSVNLEHLDNNKTEVDTDANLTEEIDQEFSEMDVERVLEKQTTHDLYCPNCHSCITKRVILLRRKRRVRDIRRKSKYDNLETHFATDAHTVNAANDQGHDTLNISSNDSPTPAADVYREPEIFRCLSCFSLFCPTGNGFKLFGASKGSNGNGEMQDAQNIPPPNKNWFFSIFASDNRKAAINEGNRPTDRSVAPNDDRNPVKIISHAEDGYIKSKEGESESLKSTVESLLIEKPPVAVDQETNMPTGKETLVDHNGLDMSIQAASSQTESFCSVGLVNSVTIEPQETQKGARTSSAKEQIPLNGVSSDVGKKSYNAVVKNNTGDDLIVIIETPPIDPASFQNVDISVHDGILPETEIDVGNIGVDSSEAPQWDILKSIVYGGLLESITSLSIVSSAAASGASTLDILVVGLANLMGGLFIIAHNLRDLKNDHSGETSTHVNKQEDHYQQVLGRRENFSVHATVVVLSFLIFGLIPPVIYGFSFRESDNRDFKIAAVAGSSLVCIVLLAIGKGYIQRPPRSYVKTVLYYVTMGIMASSLCYVVGDLIKKLLEKLNLFESSLDVTVSYPETNLMSQGWASY